MKRRFILSLLPALMLLTSCVGYHSPIDEDENHFVEDTLCHDEVFSNSESLILKSPRKLSPIDTSVPALAIQSTSESAGKISIRFVAAVTINPEHLANTTATWTRTMYNSNGSVLKSTANKTCTKAYTSIKDGESTLTIDAFNTANDNSHYTHFVLYTMRNIPVSGGENYSNCYLNAYLTLDDTIDNEYDKVSKLICTSVDQTKQVAIDTNDARENGFYVKGKTSAGVDFIVEKDTPTKGDNPSNNHASFTFNIGENDSFLIIDKEASSFVMYGASCLRGDPSSFAFSSVNDRISANYDESVIIYLNKSGEIYTSITSQIYQLFINDILSPIPNIIPGGYDDNAVFSGVTIANDNTSVKVKLNGNQIGDTRSIPAGSYTIGINLSDELFVNGDLVDISITINCGNKDVTSWNGKVFIVGEFCGWSVTNGNAIMLEETGSGTHIWTGTAHWKYGTTYSYKIRFNNEKGEWDDSNNWYPNDNLTFTPSTSNTVINYSI